LAGAKVIVMLLNIVIQTTMRFLAIFIWFGWFPNKYVQLVRKLWAQHPRTWSLEISILRAPLWVDTWGANFRSNSAGDCLEP
jgi:hypothetical protein